MLVHGSHRNMPADRSVGSTPSCSFVPSDRHDSMTGKKARRAKDTTEEIDRGKKLLREECAKLSHFDGRYFKVDFARSSLRGLIFAKCQLCHSCRRLIRGWISSRYHFDLHIQAEHSSRFPGYMMYMGNELSTSPKKLVTSNDSQKIYEKNVERFILDSELPSSTVESPSFRKLIDDLPLQKCVKLQHLSKKNIDKLQSTLTYDTKMRELREKLSKVDRVCTTADIWMNDSQQFLCVTVQWIDPETFKRNSAAIACRRVREFRSADLLKEMIDEIHESFELKGPKILVTDSGSSFAEAYRELQIRVPLGCFSQNELKEFVPGNNDGNLLEADETSTKMNDQQHEEESAMVPGFIPEFRRNSTLWRHFHCVCRSLNLIATTDVSKALRSSSVLYSSHKQSLDSCDRMWNMLMGPKKQNRLTQALGKEFMDSISEKPSSVFRLFDWVLQRNEELTATCARLGIKAPLRICDWRYIEEYSKCLRIVATAIEELQGATNCTFGYVLPTLVSLRKQLMQLSHEHKFFYCRHLMDALMTSVDTRFADYFNVQGVGNFAAVAAIVHPKFKIQWISLLPEKAQHPAFRAVADAAKSLSTTYNLRSDLDPETQLKRYFNEHRTNDVSSVSAYPVIKKMFLYYNAPLAGSTPVERLFSEATMRNASLLSQLSDEEFERRILSACNARVWCQNFVL